jgi:indole-3-glycerol phosphate synthase
VPRSLREALARPGLQAIAEIKRRSPSAGELRPDADPATIAPTYEAAGAAAISVLVDERFGGSWDDLRAARATTDAVLLAKGFFSTADHLCAAKEAGADAVLLLLRDLDDLTALRLMKAAAELGLETLVEAHDGIELDRAVSVGAPVIGINARDLSTFDLDRDLFGRLGDRFPEDAVRVAESAVLSAADVAHYRAAGADVVLVGEALVTGDPISNLRAFLAV